MFTKAIFFLAAVSLSQCLTPAKNCSSTFPESSWNVALRQCLLKPNIMYPFALEQVKLNVSCPPPYKLYNLGRKRLACLCENPEPSDTCVPIVQKSYGEECILDISCGNGLKCDPTSKTCVCDARDAQWYPQYSGCYWPEKLCKIRGGDTAKYDYASGRCYLQVGSVCLPDSVEFKCPGNSKCIPETGGNFTTHVCKCNEGLLQDATKNGCYSPLSRDKPCEWDSFQRPTQAQCDPRIGLACPFRKICSCPLTSEWNTKYAMCLDKTQLCVKEHGADGANVYFHKDQQKCLLKEGSKCGGSISLPCLGNSTCVAGRCECNPGYGKIGWRDECVAVVGINASCIPYSDIGPSCDSRQELKCDGVLEKCTCRQLIGKQFWVPDAQKCLYDWEFCERKHKKLSNKDAGPRVRLGLDDETGTCKIQLYESCDNWDDTDPTYECGAGAECQDTLIRDFSGIKQLDVRCKCKPGFKIHSAIGCVLG